jgi:plastocyanin
MKKTLTILLVFALLLSSCRWLAKEPVVEPFVQPVQQPAPPAISTEGKGTIVVKPTVETANPSTVEETAPAAQESATPKTHGLSIKGFNYEPQTIKISKGDSVTWTNLDTAPHTATGQNFNTGTLSKNQKKTITFDTTGTYDYTCTIHPSMKGTIVVE